MDYMFFTVLCPKKTWQSKDLLEGDTGLPSLYKCRVFIRGPVSFQSIYIYYIMIGDAPGNFLFFFSQNQ